MMNSEMASRQNLSHYDESNSSGAILTVENLTKKRKEFCLQTINFTLPEGYILGVIGENGAGKTTMLDCILGKLKYQGEITLSIEETRKSGLEAIKEMGFIHDGNVFFPYQSLLDNGKLLGPFYEKWDETRFVSLLRELCLDASMNYVDLSKGMKTKFQLAFALAHYPRLLVMDEPTGGLDPVFRREFLSILQREMAERLMSVIFSTHVTHDLDKVADYIMVLEEGRQKLFMDKNEFDATYGKYGNIEDILYEFHKERKAAKKYE